MFPTAQRQFEAACRLRVTPRTSDAKAQLRSISGSDNGMKNIKRVFWGFLIALTALWLVADPVLSTQYQFFALRSSLINYTGIIAIGVMSVAMILAIRPVFFEPYLGGLDKMYRLHKWLGITGLVFAVAHWLWTQAPKWLVGLGWIERPARQESGSDPAQACAVVQFLQDHRGLAEGLSEWAFYAVVLLIALALVKWFPYRHFFKTHRLLAVAYLILVFHSVVLMKPGYWDEAIAPVMALLMLAGSGSALFILFRKVGKSRRTVGLVEEIAYHQKLQVLEIGIQLKGRWNGHKTGQFAFVSFDEKEGMYPFTITSSWKRDGKLRFVIKELGDYTRTLHHILRIGNPVKIEGPYGQFNFSSNKPRQIWIGVGIGITPFIARMKRLAKHPDSKIIDLFHPTAAFSEEAIARLRRDADAAKIRLHVLADGVDGLLTVERIIEAVPKWQTSDVWFCGPAGFGESLRRDFCARGLDSDDFHQELFDMRY